MPPLFRSLCATGVLSALFFIGCSHIDGADTNKKEDVPNNLKLILAQQSEEHKARHQYRNPSETLTFVGIKPGMTVMEVLPGGGWYSRILVPYLGENGKLIGVDYASNMWSNFDWADEAFIKSRQTWGEQWREDAKAWGNGKGAATEAYSFDSVPDSLNEQVDAVLFIRAMHNLVRFDAKGHFMTDALSVSRRVLKPGGIVGIVQHESPETKSNASSDGSHGYLKRDFVIYKMEAAGFEFVGSSDVNANPKDQATDKDIVWRLLPSLRVGKSDEEKEKYRAIGESNRMTLLFRKK